jgi:hypothetical protein
MYSTSSHFPPNLIVYIMGADPCVQYCGEYIYPHPPKHELHFPFTYRTVTIVANFYRFVLFCTDVKLQRLTAILSEVAGLHLDCPSYGSPSGKRDAKGPIV